MNSYSLAQGLVLLEPQTSRMMYSNLALPDSINPSYLLQTVKVSWNPSALSLERMTPSCDTLSWYVVPMVDTLYAVTFDAESTLKICAWQVLVVKQSWL